MFIFVRTAEQIYAMKIMWKSQVIRDRALQQVKDEVTIAVSCVDNPLIVKTWFYWQSKRFLYIITDFIENGELLSLWLRVHHFPERVVAAYAIEMALALDYLHRRGIIYRDIKMENILLDKRGHVQLIDFGLSKWLPQGERTCTICGTIQYMAPEVLSVEPYDHAVDWWSLGILVYALLSGEYPLNAAKDHIQMNEKVSNHIFELDQEAGKYSVESCDLVRKLLRKNSYRRMKSLAECKNEPFFLKEMRMFVERDLLEKKKITSQKERENLTLLVNENFWNPYFIIENYSPLELLFEELSAGSASSKEVNLPIKVTQHKPRMSRPAPAQTASNLVAVMACPPPPPPPPPPPQTQTQVSNSSLPRRSSDRGRNSLESSLTTTSNEESSSALSRTTLSARNTNTSTSSDEEITGDHHPASSSNNSNSSKANNSGGDTMESEGRLRHDVGVEGDDESERDESEVDDEESSVGSDPNSQNIYESDNTNDGDDEERDDVIEIIDYEQEYKMRSSYLFGKDSQPLIKSASGKSQHTVYSTNI